MNLSPVIRSTTIVFTSNAVMSMRTSPNDCKNSLRFRLRLDGTRLLSDAGKFVISFLSRFPVLITTVNLPLTNCSRLESDWEVAGVAALFCQSVSDYRPIHPQTPPLGQNLYSKPPSPTRLECWTPLYPQVRLVQAYEKTCQSLQTKLL